MASRISGKTGGGDLNSESPHDPYSSSLPTAGGAASPSRRRHAVFVSDFVHLERSYAELAPRLLDRDEPWREKVADLARHQGFDVVIGEVREREETVIVPLRFEPAAFERFLPWLDGDLELLGAGEGHSRLSVSGRYRVPLARLGTALDRLVMHRVAEMAVRRFLGEIADCLDSG